MIREINRNQIDIKTAYGERVFLVEAVPLSNFEAAHIPGAIHMPVERVGEVASRYLGNFGHEIVICGLNERSVEPEIVAKELDRLGYRNLYLYRGGKEDWMGAGDFQESVHRPTQPEEKIKMKELPQAGSAIDKIPIQGKYLLAGLGVLLGYLIYRLRIRSFIERRNNSRIRLSHRVVRIEQDSGLEVDAESFHSASAVE